jgi:hypothetical protein
MTGTSVVGATLKRRGKVSPDERVMPNNRSISAAPGLT